MTPERQKDGRRAAPDAGRKRLFLAAYLGGSGKFAQAIADFAEAYADQNERDYATLQTAVKDGRAQVTTNI